MEWIESLVLGLVQGLTEFLPVSSDGHLTVTQQAFAGLKGYARSGKENLFFNVVLHLGTLLAIVVYYRSVAVTGLKGLLGSQAVPLSYRRPALIRLGVLVALTIVPLLPWKFFKHDLEATLEDPFYSGVGFLITAAVLLITTRLKGGEKGPLETTWVDALLIGVAQTFAPLPGVSRSGMTCAMALFRGLSRSWAVGFSLLIAIPAILGAEVLEIKDVDRSTLTPDRIAQTIAGTIVAGVVGYGAIIWLVKIVRNGRLWYFSIYLIALAIVVLGARAYNSKGSPASSKKAPHSFVVSPPKALASLRPEFSRLLNHN